MSSTAFIIVLCAAILHAMWNITVKQVSHNKAVPFLGIVAVTLCGVPFALSQTGASSQIMMHWHYFLITGFIHAVYFIGLMHAYSRYEISIIYPISRGIAVIFPALLGFMYLNEAISIMGLVGILLILMGILVKSYAPSNSPQSIVNKSLVIAILIGLTVSAYVVVDRIAINVINPILYIVGMYVVFCAILGPYIFYFYPQDLRPAIQHYKRHSLIVGLGVMGAYFLILNAFRLSELGYIVALRELSILFVLLFSTVFLRERLSGPKGFAVFLIILGAVLIKLT